MSRSSSKDYGPTATDLIEESVHLLRKNPRELIWYYVGVGPFAVALLYFWSYVTWFAPPDGEVAVGALFLAVVFGWMKAAQRRFSLIMFARRMGDEPSRWSRRTWLSEISTQLRLQASGILLVPLSLIFTVPFGWVYAYYQSATVAPDAVTAGSGSRYERAVVHARLWPKQNHAALAILSGLWLMVFLNIAVAFYTLPALATRWLGMKTIFSLDGWSYLNSTFLVLVVVLTHLLVDPLIKIFYVLRVFHADARQTGIDVALVLKGERLLRRRVLTGAAVLLLSFGAAPAPRIHAAEVATETRLVSTAELDRSLDRVLEEPDFRWRLRPLPAPPSKAKEGMIKGFIRSTFSVLNQMVRTVYRWMRKISDWISDLFPGKKAPSSPEEKTSGGSGSFDWMGGLQLAAYVLLFFVIVLLVFVALKVWRHNRESRSFAASAQMPDVAPDLDDETVEASRLPADGWLDLARQKMAAGEWRLALRALFLATLARHAHEGRVSLAKFKTNLDYEIELRRRVPGRPAVVDEFRGRRRSFEEVWYGTVPASDGLARDWLRQMEGQG